MGYVVLLVIVLSLVPSFLQSQLPPQGYIGLFADDNHSSWCVQGVGFYQVEMWMWCLPICCQIIPHPSVGVYQFANCEPGFPVEPCTKFTNLYFNYDPAASECQGTAAESVSWGSIKAMLE